MNREEVMEQETPQDAPQEMTQQDQAYISGLMKLLHSKETSGNIVSILKSAPPEKSIPQAALTIFEDYNGVVEKKAQKQTSLETRLMGGIYLVQDLMEIGGASRAWEQELTEEDLPSLLEATLNPYIQKGLEDGSIDPVELQAAVEPLMDDEQLAQGLAGAEATGVPMVAGQQAAMETYASQRERKAMRKATDKQAGQNRQQMLQGGA